MQLQHEDGDARNRSNRGSAPRRRSRKRSFKDAPDRGIKTQQSLRLGAALPRRDRADLRCGREFSVSIGRSFSLVRPPKFIAMSLWGVCHQSVSFQCIPFCPVKYRDNLSGWRALCSRFAPDPATRRGRPWQGGLCQPCPEQRRQPIIFAHGIHTPAAPAQGCREVPAHSPSSGSSMGSRTRSRRVSPLPSIGGERCTRPGSGHADQSVPRMAKGSPVATVWITSGSPSWPVP